MAKVTILPTGLWDVPRNEIIAAETPEVYAENRRHTIPGFSVLVQDEKVGNVLYDTGIAENWDEIWPPQFRKDYSFHKLENLREQLAKVNLTPADIDILVQSHLHYDHAGNIKMFQNTKAGQKIILTEAEAHEAFVKVNLSPDGVSGAYFKPEIIMDGIAYDLINEDMDLSDDIHLFIQTGHTPGVIGMVVKTEENGTFVFPSDACYSTYNFGPPIVLPGLCVNAEDYRADIEKLAAMKEKYPDCKIVFGHDVEDFKQWKLAPDGYK